MTFTTFCGFATVETAFKRAETLAGAARNAERKQQAGINITRLKKAKEEGLI